MFIFHVDANSAFLSWSAAYALEQGHPIDFRDIPSVVGGDQQKRRGIVLAKSIPAKHYGIRTGDTLVEARSLCPELVVVSPNYQLYVSCSDALYHLLSEYSPIVQRYSVDECFLEYKQGRFTTDPFQVGLEIKNRVREELGFTVNVGLSSNKLLAKMGSELKKPDHFHTLFPNEVEEKMWPLPVEELFMVGRATKRKLYKLNIRTIGELANTPQSLLIDVFKSHGALIHQYANGIDNSRVVSGSTLLQKNVGNSTTIAFDACDIQEAHLVLLSLCERVAMRLRRMGGMAQVIAVTVKTAEFVHYQLQRKLPTPVDETRELFQAAKNLFDEVWKKEPIRHIGIHLSELVPNDFYQLTFLDPKNREKEQQLDKTVDALRNRFGEKSLVRSCFLDSGIKPLQGGVNEGDYPMMSSHL
ncbi:DNA polymerase IV [Clostridia bacterium]|nr:DNA polymerase IV [Clostridia bacterium]